MPSRGKAGLLLLAVLVLASGWWAHDWYRLQQRIQDVPLGFSSTLPILWDEAPDVAAMLNPGGPPHWARAVLERHGRLLPLDRLDAAHLGRVSRLVLIQPRPLAPDENLALDEWLRGGGRLLLLADPMLTEDSAFDLGDKRRPQDTALLSPILARWGLALDFDEGQPLIEGSRDVLGADVPVLLPGHLRLTGSQRCNLLGGGIAVTCRIGSGRLLVLADAGLVERDDPGGIRDRAFDQLVTAALDAA